MSFPSSRPGAKAAAYTEEGRESPTGLDCYQQPRTFFKTFSNFVFSKNKCLIKRCKSLSLPPVDMAPIKNVKGAFIFTKTGIKNYKNIKI